MYQIALCDDETEELDKAELLLKSYQEQREGYGFSIRRFRSADELLWQAAENDYMPDILFLDILMPGKQGIKAALELRGLGSRCHIIFLTISREYALDAFSVDADQYLLKPVSETALFSVLDKLTNAMAEESKKYLLLKTDGRIRRVALQEILYCEAQKKRQCIHLTDGTQLFQNTTMAKLDEQLSEYPEFVRVGIAYIINLEHIESMNARELQMEDGRQIYLPRGAYQGLKEKYFSYYCAEEAFCPKPSAKL